MLEAACVSHTKPMLVRHSHGRTGYAGGILIIYECRETSSRDI